MNFSLNQILDIANEIHGKVLNEKNYITVSDYINSIHHLRAYIEQIKSITRRIEAIHRTCLNKIQEYVDQNTLIQETYEKEVNFKGNIKEWGEKMLKNVSRGKKIMGNYSTIGTVSGCTEINLIPDIYITAKIVKNLNEIPNINLYWVNGQFAIRINNILIKGNMGNIYTKDKMNKITKVKNIKKCILGPECKKIIENKECSFYHDNMVNTDHNKSFLIDKNNIRNFTNSSWMYSSESFNKNNKYMRHIGNRNTLDHDIDRLLRCDKKIIDNEIDTRVNQIMHDILILMALKNKGVIF